MYRNFKVRSGQVVIQNPVTAFDVALNLKKKYLKINIGA